MVASRRDREAEFLARDRLGNVLLNFPLNLLDIGFAASIMHQSDF